MKRAALTLALFCVILYCLIPIVWADNLILKVPDWNQPSAYGVNGYPDWCSPTSGANIMGYWEDEKACGWLADRQAYPNSPAYPGTLATWEQGLWHDGTIEMGWFMDTGNWNTNVGPFPPLVGGTASGNIATGLVNYAKGSWTDNDYPPPPGVPNPGSGIVKTAFQNAAAATHDYINQIFNLHTLTWSRMWDTYVTEINSGHPVEVTFETWVNTFNPPTHGNVNGQDVEFYPWGTVAPHSVVGVGFIDPDPNNLTFNDEYFICQDTWQSTGRYVAVPLAVGKWLQNDYIWPIPQGNIWVGGFSSDWGTNTNWIQPGAVIPNGQGVSVTFGNQPSKNSVVDLMVNGQTVGYMTFTPITSTTIQSTGNMTLTLDNGANNASVEVNGTHTFAANLNIALNSDTDFSVWASSAQLTINSVISDGVNGAKGITKAGTGLLVLGGLNTYTGVTRINYGKVNITTLANGGAASNIGQSTNNSANLVFDGGTLSVLPPGGGVTTDRGFTVDHNGGTLENRGTSLSRWMNWTGNVVCTGNGDRTLTVNDLRASSGGSAGNNSLTGSITDPITGKLAFTYIGVTGGRFWFAGPAKAYSGDTTIQGGAFWLGNVTGGASVDDMLPFGPGMGNLNINAGALLNLYHHNTNINGLNDGSSGGGTVEKGDTTTNKTFTLGNGNADGDFSGSIIASASAYPLLSLAKVGAGTQILRGTNYYTGATTISDGVLELASTGQIASSSGISTTTTAKFLVNGGSHTVGAISGTGETEVLAGDLTALCVVQGHISIGSGARLIIAPTGMALSNDFMPVPEPSTLVLLTIAAAALVAYRWKRHVRE